MAAELPGAALENLLPTEREYAMIDLATEAAQTDHDQQFIRDIFILYVRNSYGQTT